jgi:hypothetical protein
MNWAVLIPIIAQYGIPLAESLFQKWSSGSLPTQADFDALRALASQTAADRMKAALVRAGIPLDSPQAAALIAQAS